MFQKLDVTSFVPRAFEETDVLSLIDSKDTLDDDDDDDDFELVFYISPELLEQLTGGGGYRGSGSNKKGRYKNNEKSS